MEFEFDPAKSQANKAKHGIDFEEAQALWNDDNGLEFPGSFDNEMRNLIIGRIADKHWTAIVTYRDDKVRIISVRRARDL
jgi:uncharacterized DUF497 family protein